LLRDTNILKRKIVIYDAMDDVLSFPEIINDIKLKADYFGCENELYLNSKLVIASSENLKKKLISRYGEREIFVINNGVIPDYLVEKQLKLPTNFENYFNLSKKIKLTYIGTISSWIDFDLILKILNKFEDIEIVLVGPCQIDPPCHKNLIVLGQIEHKHIFKVMENSNALIMPFIVNDLIESVNPVKLYEYIYSKKPCISVSYEEVMKFNEFVYLYNEYFELTNFIELLISKKLTIKKSVKEIELFCSENTWDKRVNEILKLMKNLDLNN
jgi:teichuronic acid biosynthesis glycosyltransferase TuaH